MTKLKEEEPPDRARGECLGVCSAGPGFSFFSPEKLTEILSFVWCQALGRSLGEEELRLRLEEQVSHFLPPSINRLSFYNSSFFSPFYLPFSAMVHVPYYYQLFSMFVFTYLPILVNKTRRDCDQYLKRSLLFVEIMLSLLIMICSGDQPAGGDLLHIGDDCESKGGSSLPGIW